MRVDPVWKKISDTYQQWDQDRSGLMAIDDLSERLPDIDYELLLRTLEQAAQDGRVDAPEEGGAFRLIPNH
ncbi:hypothetical protein [Noviherbaspirillum denitrificans]|uniref:EF-hand domain-containing protein n=1 Tax=Noviherbaspirillum denitrificans TaxID=1968433 RepID=A0A254TG64_9BURK|nr:hypothetical protein [Noviherbaspirillum denitrificans]OWW21651.1 hypothetical protein AYR66_21345 [Noviherbaspirillum denitrificans]